VVRRWYAKQEHKYHRDSPERRATNYAKAPLDATALSSAYKARRWVGANKVIRQS